MSLRDLRVAGGAGHEGRVMHVQTTRFGTVEVGNDRLMDFPAGLLGFSSYTRFALLQPDEDGIFYWLQSVDSAELAFVVTDPTRWCDEYEATVRREHMDLLDLESVCDARVFVIVNKYDDMLTANLQGPLVINLRNRRGMQIVLSDQRWTTRREIARLQQPVQRECVSA
ncbi:MAG: flagellar assembly protein FliW [Phycisphaerales bacterium]|nr:flagellar assembly protein FliW [Phycisphaerales bacterium]MDP6310770.1 flagellar assembly protein FliW [Phycisphaerales bacterium]MDP7086398.1 flagellar assembly protein FliW [Phycisphaerales bacterium]MDP7188424.1 flagellar assembly protein FliW [Phycisphaerales bacterium]MDP7518562.1 flagellar assembly protein FliW [Phycisphaerales bacterium]